ncbi:MAG: TonB-dependent receptor [Opitutales bacterium]|nr:TonB-dependent receptor [Opitutales bacterium]
MTVQPKKQFIIASRLSTCVVSLGLINPGSNAQESYELESLIIGATRTERSLESLGISADILRGTDLEQRMIRDLRTSFMDVGGVFAPSDEALASTADITIRGNSGTRVLSMVDGVKTNSAIFSAGRFMAGASGFNLDRVEIVRGPQSTLYGSSAIGGVIRLETRRGQGDPTYRVTAEAGSYNSQLLAFQGQGETGNLDYSFHVANQESDNEGVDNEGKMKSYSFRLDYALSDTTTVGIASRGEFTDYSNPGGDLTPPPSDRIQSDTFALSAYLETETDRWSQRATLSLLDEYYRQTGFLYIGDAANLAFEWQNAYDASDSVRIVSGVSWERQEGNDNSFPKSEGDSNAIFAQAEIASGEAIDLVLGARHDDYEFSGSKTTWRANGLWRLSDRFAARAAFGTAFRAPNFFRLFSTSSFALGNPNLQPEESEGWEIGLDAYSNRGNFRAGVTYFRNDIENLIVWTPTEGFDGTYENRDIAENYGVETYVDLDIREDWSANFAYTWTESNSTNLAFGSTTRQPAIPRHQFSFSNAIQFGQRISANFGLSYVFDRETFGGLDMDNYLLLRIASRYQVNDALAWTLRVENALDEDYTASESSFSGRIKARGMAAFGGLEWDF